jgi:hypothetical protein
MRLSLKSATLNPRALGVSDHIYRSCVTLPRLREAASSTTAKFDVPFWHKVEVATGLAGYEARTAKYLERCLFATTKEMRSGTARNAPIGPHIQAQKATDRKTRKGFRVRRCPMIVGVMICPPKSSRRSRG